MRAPFWVRAGDASSQWLNTLFLRGEPNESISGRAYREGWRRTEKVINVLLSWKEPDHCRRAHEADVVRAHEWARLYPLPRKG